MWIFLSLFAAAGDAARDSATKRFASKVPLILISWSYSLFMVPFCLPGMLKNCPEIIPENFWPLLWCIASMHVISGIVTVTTIKSGDLSLTIPLSAFTPVFLLFTSPFLTGDSIGAIGIVGALMVFSGSYLLNISHTRYGILGPLKAIASQPGARGMLFLSFLWSITGSIDRIAVRLVPIEFWGGAQMLAISALFLPIVLLSRQAHLIFVPKNFVRLALIGAVNAFSFFPYLAALHRAPAHFVVCVKRTSILFSIILGGMIFKEKNLAERLAGALLMLTGVIVISSLS